MCEKLWLQRIRADGKTLVLGKDGQGAEEWCWRATDANHGTPGHDCDPAVTE